MTGSESPAPPIEPPAQGKLRELRAQYRRAFAFDAGAVLLNNAGVAPMCKPAQAAIARTLEHFGLGWFALGATFADYEHARAVIAKLCGAQPQNVAMFHTCAAAISQVALGLRLAPGDEIVLLDQEYHSNFYPWHAAAQRAGATVRGVPSTPDFSIDQERLHAAITANTRVVAVSFVQYQTGAVADLPALAKACRAVGAWLVVDAIQGLGLLPFDLSELGVDAVCGGGHKWLCGGPHGFLALAPGRAAELLPIMHGGMTYGGFADLARSPFPIDSELGTAPRSGRKPWPDARRFEPGTPLFFGAVACAAAIELQTLLGRPALHAAALEIADALIAGLRERGAKLLLPTPPPSGLRAPILTFVPRGEVAETAHRLEARRIACSQRGGGIRLSPHAFNDETDVERFFVALDSP